VRVPTGTRIEVTEQIFGNVKEEIRRVIGENDIDLMIDNIGVPPVAYNLAYGDNSKVGTWDGEILISLKSSKKRSSSDYMQELRSRLKKRFPNYLFYFQPADLIGQIINFGLPTPIDVSIIGYDKKNNLQIAKELVDKISMVPGAVDVHLHQNVDAPELFLKVNRTLLSQQGLSQIDFMRDLLINFSDSTVIAPNFWLDREMGLAYPIAVYTPKYRVESVDELMRMPLSYPLTKLRTPLAPPFNSRSELLTNLASLERRVTPAVINHYNIQPVYDVYANIQNSHLGQVADRIQKIIDEYQSKMAPGNEIKLMGMVENMNRAYLRLGLGFAAALILVYLILVVNFQSWVDPWIIFLTLLGAISGVIWSLFITHTPLTVPAIMGGIMSLGVATANSILLVAFANQQLFKKKTNVEAVHEAAVIRLRPILMTALAMIIGMIPMALSLGTGGEENAPLGRAVIGGLIFATVTTLFFVPVIFSYLRKTPNPYISREEEQPEEKRDVQ
jgi:multidrug efflux pump subunit AcrB